MRIQTHAGRFHADEVFAIGMLCLIESGGSCTIPETVTILRDRQASASEADYVLDMGGGPYDHHHQISFRPSSPPVASEAPSDAIPYATAGLVWRDHGVRVIDTLHPDALSDDQKQRIQEEVDAMLIAGIDLADNGMRPIPAACHAYTIVDAVRDMNRLEQGEQNQKSQFRKAVLLAMHILRTRIEAATYAQHARSRFLAADWYRVDQVLVLPEYVPWKHVILGDAGFSDIQFVVHPHPRPAGSRPRFRSTRPQLASDGHSPAYGEGRGSSNSP
jgi:uncharacterized UPF0160 family protein